MLDFLDWFFNFSPTLHLLSSYSTFWKSASTLFGNLFIFFISPPKAPPVLCSNFIVSSSDHMDAYLLSEYAHYGFSYLSLRWPISLRFLCFFSFLCLLCIFVFRVWGFPPTYRDPWFAAPIAWWGTKKMMQRHLSYLDRACLSTCGFQPFC